MKAIILAAGQSTRLYPLTKDTPKCLLKVGNKAIIKQQVDALVKYGIDDIIVVIGYFGEKIRKFLNNSVCYVENREYASTNSSYSLWLARKYVLDGFIYLNSDLLFNHLILKKLLDCKYENAMIVDSSRKSDDDMFKVIMDGERILKLDKRIKSIRACAEGIGPVKFSKCGAMKIINKIEDHIIKSDRNQWCYSIFSEAANDIDLWGVDISGLPWIEVDTPHDLEIAHSLSPLLMEGTNNKVPHSQ